jgi:hypothetical protein
MSVWALRRPWPKLGEPDMKSESERKSAKAVQICKELSSACAGRDERMPVPLTW